MEKIKEISLDLLETQVDEIIAREVADEE